MRVKNKLSQKAILFYQKKISPLKGVSVCKYHQSCSAYGLECYQKYNFFKASWLTFKRICFCNFFAKGGEY